MYYTARKTILFRLNHGLKTLVRKVDYVSAAGVSPANEFRTGGPVALITNLCVFSFDKDAAHFRLESVHLGHSLEEVRGSTGFEFDVTPDLTAAPSFSRRHLELLRGPVAERVAKNYPAFAASVWGIAA